MSYQRLQSSFRLKLDLTPQRLSNPTKSSSVLLRFRLLAALMSHFNKLNLADLPSNVCRLVLDENLRQNLARNLVRLGGVLVLRAIMLRKLRCNYTLEHIFQTFPRLELIGAP